MSRIVFTHVRKRAYGFEADFEAIQVYGSPHANPQVIIHSKFHNHSIDMFEKQNTNCFPEHQLYNSGTDFQVGDAPCMIYGLFIPNVGYYPYWCRTIAVNVDV